MSDVILTLLRSLLTSNKGLNVAYFCLHSTSYLVSDHWLYTAALWDHLSLNILQNTKKWQTDYEVDCMVFWLAGLIAMKSHLNITGHCQPVCNFVTWTTDSSEMQNERMNELLFTTIHVVSALCKFNCLTVVETHTNEMYTFLWFFLIRLSFSFNDSKQEMPSLPYLT